MCPRSCENQCPDTMSFYLCPMALFTYTKSFKLCISGVQSCTRLMLAEKGSTQT